MISLRRSSPSSLYVGRVCLRQPFRFFCSTFFSSVDNVGDKPILVRDFIHSALYDRNYGYFAKRSGSVGVLDKSIKFNQLQGRSAYLQYLDNLYKQNDISWFTPVELFKPWYAYGIAEAILRTANFSVPLKIYEIGGGSGTCAKCIMDYMMLNAPDRVYKNMTYVSVEISSSLAKKQQETVGEVGSHLSRFRVECRDALDRSGWANCTLISRLAPPVSEKEVRGSNLTYVKCEPGYQFSKNKKKTFLTFLYNNLLDLIDVFCKVSVRHGSKVGWIRPLSLNNLSYLDLMWLVGKHLRYNGDLCEKAKISQILDLAATWAMRLAGNQTVFCGAIPTFEKTREMGERFIVDLGRFCAGVTCISSERCLLVLEA